MKKKKRRTQLRSSEWNVDVASNPFLYCVYFLPVSSSPASVVLATRLLPFKQTRRRGLNLTCRSSDQWNVDVLSIFFVFAVSIFHLLPYFSPEADVKIIDCYSYHRIVG